MLTVLLKWRSEGDLYRFRASKTHGVATLAVDRETEEAPGDGTAWIEEHSWKVEPSDVSPLLGWGE